MTVFEEWERFSSHQIVAGREWMPSAPISCIVRYRKGESIRISPAEGIVGAAQKRRTSFPVTNLRFRA
jgi:hypothetical protein